MWKRNRQMKTYFYFSITKPLSKQIHKLENWVIKRQKATAEKYPDLCRPAPANCKWLCFEEFSNVEIKPVSLSESILQPEFL